jgi:hypothetical protein
MASAPDGKGVIVYDDGCEEEVLPGRVVEVGGVRILRSEGPADGPAWWGAGAAGISSRFLLWARLLGWQ